MSMKEKNLSHVAGTFLIQADGAFLNGAGLDRTREDRNTTVPKWYRDGVGNRVPYVSAQAWRRWLRNTLIKETGWPASELRAIDLSERGTTNKIATELDPVDFAEDDIFGYMRAAKGQGRETAGTAEDERTEEEADRDATVKFFKKIGTEFKAVQSGKVTEGRGKTKKEIALSDKDRIDRAGKLVKTLQKDFPYEEGTERRGQALHLRRAAPKYFSLTGAVPAAIRRPGLLPSIDYSLVESRFPVRSYLKPPTLRWKKAW